MLTRTETESILNISTNQEKIKVTRGETGPAYLDAWLMLFKRKDIWMKTEPAASAQSNKQIIWCVPHEAVSDVPFVRSFITAITTYFDVYIWPGNNKSLNQVRPSSNTDEFLARMSSTFPGTVASVKETLGYQGLQTDNYIIIDASTLVIMAQRAETILRKRFPDTYKRYISKNCFQKSPTELDLRVINLEKFEEIYPYINANQIESISLYIPTEKEIHLYKQMFPNLKTIGVEGANRKWLDANIHHFNDMNLYLIKFLGGERIILPSNCKLKQLSIEVEEKPHTKHIGVAKGASIQSLEVIGLRDGKLNIKNLKDTKRLAIKARRYVAAITLSLPKRNNIAELSLTGCNIKNLDMALFPNLKHLVYQYNYSKSLPMTKRSILEYLCLKEPHITNPLLETIEYRNYNEPIIIDLSRHTRLKTAILESSDSEKPILPSYTSIQYQSQVFDITYPDLIHDSFLFDIYGNLPATELITTKEFKKLLTLENTDTSVVKAEATHLQSAKHLDMYSCEIFPTSLPFNLKTLRVNETKWEDVPIAIAHDELMCFYYKNQFRTNIQFDLQANSLERLYIDAPKAQVSFHRLKCPKLKSLHINCANSEMINLLLHDLPEGCVLVPMQDEYNERYVKDYRKKFNGLVYVGIMALVLDGLFAIYKFVYRDEDYDPAASNSTAANSTFSNSTEVNSTSIPEDTPSLSPIQATSLPSTPLLTTPMHGNDSLSTTLTIVITSGMLLLTLLIAALVLYRRYLRQSDDLTTGHAYMDGRTSSKGRTKDKKHDSYNYNFYTGKQYYTHHMRCDIQNAIAVEDNHLMFYSDLKGITEIAVDEVGLHENREVMKKVMIDIDANGNEGLGHFEGKLISGERYPLPTLYPIQSPMDLIRVYNSVPNSVKFYYCASTQQIYIKRNDDLKHTPEKIEFFYRCKLDPRYLLKDTATPGSTAKMHQVDPTLLLPKNIIRDIRKHLEITPAYNYLLSNSISVNEKLCRLTRTLRKDFDGGDLTSIPKDPVERLFKILNERKGVCRHRSEVLMTMAWFLGVPIVNPGNPSHLFGQVPFIDEQQNVYYQRVDTCWDVLPEVNKDMTVFHEAAKTPDNELKEIVIADSPEIDRKKAVTDIYRGNLLTAVTKSSISSLEPIIENKDKLKTPLIKLQGNQTQFNINEQLLLHLEMMGLDVVNKHLYINSPAEFEHYLNPNVITRNEVTTTTGPLQKIITDPSNLGVVVINWANFTPAEGATYQSMLDTKPLLTVGDATYQISDKTLIFGMIKDSQSLGEAFISRNKQWELTDKFFKAKPVYQRSGGIPRSVDTFHMQNWREKLFGDILINGERYIVDEAKLLEAIAYNVPLIVYNPPDDEEFRLLMHHVNEERKLFHNGEFIKIPPNVVILTQEKENQLQSPNVKIINKDARANRQLIHIDIQNLHELMKQFIVNKDNNKGQTVRGGLLQSFNPANQIFYIHGFIPKDYWQEILAYIQKMFPEKNFNFELAPGAEIQGIAKERAAQTRMVHYSKLQTYPANVITTNDLDYVTTLLKRIHRNATVIRVNPRTSFTEHIVEVKRIPDTKSDFLYTEHGVLQQLIAGKTVILSGDIPIALYYQLLPLLSDRPHIYANGKRIDVDGKLIIVTPSQTADGKLQADVKCELTIQDYRYLFCGEIEKAHQLFDSISLFYELIGRMPHKGPGRPPIPELNYQRIKKIMEQFERSPMHSHNPMKGLLSYDYPRRSDEQNYINVLAKHIFCCQDDSPVRIGKLNLLLREHKIDSIESMKPYVWQLLNCFSGQQLTFILGNNLRTAIDTTGFPQLSPRVLGYLFETVNSYRTNDHYYRAAEKDKAKRQLATLLEDNAKPIILLKGAPGVGKTYAIRGAIKNYYEGEEKILKWLTAPNEGKPIIYLWDEANKELAGTLDFIIKGLASEDRTVYYKDKPYRLSPNHKFILTANPENFPNRYYHSAIQEYAETIYLDKPDDTALEKHANARLDTNIKKFSPSLVYACRLVEKYNPFLPMSLRDVENLACRANMLCATHKTLDDDTMKEKVFYACVYEFSGSIKDPALRKSFISELKAKMGLNHIPDYQTNTSQVCNGKFYPPSKSYMVDSLQQDFIMRMRAIKNAALSKADDPKNPVDYKQAIIVEGEPGVGKSTFFRAMVAHHKEQLKMYRSNLLLELAHMQPGAAKADKELELEIVTKEINKPVVEISVGPGAAKTLKAAYKDEVILIGDEANLDPAFEKELNQILSGVDENKVQVRRPGFIFLGSQNSSSHGGRMNVDEALRNRTRLIYQDVNSKEDFIAYARFREIPYPEVYVEVFTEIKKEYPYANTRTFYDTLDEIAKDKAFIQKFSDDVRGFRQFSSNDNDSPGEREPLLDHRKPH